MLLQAKQTQTQLLISSHVRLYDPQERNVGDSGIHAKRAILKHKTAHTNTNVKPVKPDEWSRREIIFIKPGLTWFVLFVGAYGTTMATKHHCLTLFEECFLNPTGLLMCLFFHFFSFSFFTLLFSGTKNKGELMDVNGSQQRLYR